MKRAGIILSSIFVFSLFYSTVFGASTLYDVYTGFNTENSIGAGEDGVIGSFYVIDRVTVGGGSKISQFDLDATNATIGSSMIPNDDIAEVSVWIDINQNGSLERDSDSLLGQADDYFGSDGFSVSIPLSGDDQVSLENGETKWFIVVVTMNEVPDGSIGEGSTIDVQVTLTDNASTPAQNIINVAGIEWIDDILDFTATHLKFIDSGYNDLTGGVGHNMVKEGVLLCAVDDWGNVDSDFTEKVQFLLYTYSTLEQIISNFTATANTTDDNITWGSSWASSPVMTAGVLAADPDGAEGKVCNINYNPVTGINSTLVLVARSRDRELEGSVTISNYAVFPSLSGNGLETRRGIEIYDVNHDGHIDFATIFFNAPVQVAGSLAAADFIIGSGYGFETNIFPLGGDSTIYDWQIGFDAGGKGIRNPGLYGITLRISQKDEYDTDMKPDITYAGMSAIQDFHGGIVPSFTSSDAVEVDKAKPFLVKAATKDNGAINGTQYNGIIDNIVLTFSERVRNVSTGSDTTNTGLVVQSTSGVTFTGNVSIDSSGEIVTLGITETAPNTGLLPVIRVNQAPVVSITDCAFAATGASSYNSCYPDKTNTGTESLFSCRDESPMVVYSVQTLDHTMDGRLDNIRVTFSEDTFVSGYEGVGFYTSHAMFSSGTNYNGIYTVDGVLQQSSKVYDFSIIPVGLDNVFDSEALPYFSYDPSIGNIKDVAGNELSEYGYVALVSPNAHDGAYPVVVSIKTGDAYTDTAYTGSSSFDAEGANGRIDNLTITFSEKVQSAEGAQFGMSALDHTISQFEFVHSLGSTVLSKNTTSAVIGAPIWTDIEQDGDTNTVLHIPFEEIPFGTTGMVNNGDTGNIVNVIYDPAVINYGICDYSNRMNPLQGFNVDSIDGAAPFIVKGICNGWGENGFANILTYDIDEATHGNTTDVDNGNGYIDGFVLKFTENTTIDIQDGEVFTTSLDGDGELDFDSSQITINNNSTDTITIIGVPNETGPSDTGQTPLLSFKSSAADIRDASGNKMDSFSDFPSYDGAPPVITQVYPGVIDTELIITFSENVWGHYEGGQRKDIDSLFYASSVVFGYQNNNDPGASYFTAAFVKEGETGNKIVATVNESLSEEDISGDLVWVRKNYLFDDANANEPGCSDNQVEYSLVGTGIMVGIFDEIVSPDIFNLLVSTDTDNIPLRFGFDSDATDGIDALLGESELPPKPPAGVFDSRFTGLELGNGTWSDIRNSAETSHEYIIEIQRASGEDVTLTWDSFASRDEIFLLKDTITGTLINVNMKDVIQYTITNPAITQLKIEHHSGEWEMYYTAGWDMVSLGLDIEDKTLSSLFPSAISLYEFDNEYQQVTELEIGKGYWLNLSSGITKTLYGAVIDNLTLDLPEKWSMIGNITQQIAVSDIVQNPADNIISIYGYDNGQYVAVYPGGSEILEQGKGYWINLGVSGTIDIPSDLGAGKVLVANRAGSEFLQDCIEIPLTVTSSLGQKTVAFYVSDEPTKAGTTNRTFEMPPVPPFGSFDVRIADDNTNGMGNLVISSDEDFETIIDIMVPESNTTTVVSWVNNGLPLDTYFISDGVRTVDMASVDRIDITDSGSHLAFIQKINVQTREPIAYSLAANYPNPFNPETTITYSIELAGLTQLSIYNVLGQEIRNLVYESKQPGIYTARWDGTDMFGNTVSGGIYLYRLKVNDFVETKKMLLMK